LRAAGGGTNCVLSGEDSFAVLETGPAFLSSPVGCNSNSSSSGSAAGTTATGGAAGAGTGFGTLTAGALAAGDGAALGGGSVRSESRSSIAKSNSLESLIGGADNF